MRMRTFITKAVVIGTIVLSTEGRMPGYLHVRRNALSAESVSAGD